MAKGSPDSGTSGLSPRSLNLPELLNLFASLLSSVYPSLLVISLDEILVSAFIPSMVGDSSTMPSIW